jgi:hypothetical protein
MQQPPAGNQRMHTLLLHMCMRNYMLPQEQRVCWVLQLLLSAVTVLPVHFAKLQSPAAAVRTYGK